MAYQVVCYTKQSSHVKVGYKPNFKRWSSELTGQI